MSMGILVAATGVLSLGIGLLIRHLFAVKELSVRRRKGDEIIEKAKKDAQEIKYLARKEAKEIAKEEKVQSDLEIKSKQQELLSQERNIAKKEAALDTKLELQEKEVEKLKEKETEITQMKNRIDDEIHFYRQKQKEVSDRLSEVASMSKEAAKVELMKVMEEEAKLDFSKELKRLDDEAKEMAEKNAKMIISTAISRYSGEYIAEKAIGAVELPSDEIKGRLIGREGRNIRAFEQICGVDLIIDDTPEVVVVSSFNVVRREIAKMTIEKLIVDGRIHPAKIEEFYEKSKSEMDKNLRELGEKAQMEVGVHGIHPEVLKLLGALNYRTSYTQNQYQHAIESSFLCGAMAAELGINVKQARRAGLLHDIGKVLDAASEGSHAIVGSEFLKKFGESPDIVHAVLAHHEETPAQSILAHLVSAADALSGARPGARRAMVESYVSRLTDIETIVNSFEGIQKSYAISGGREVRVFVESDKVSDEQTVTLSHDISKKIENEMSYPGTIKVIVVREIKASAIAK